MGGQERGHMGVKAKRYKIIITILTMIIRMMIKWYNDVSAGCHKLPKDFKWQGQLSGLWWWWWWWCWVSRTKGHNNNVDDDDDDDDGDVDDDILPTNQPHPLHPGVGLEQPFLSSVSPSPQSCFPICWTELNTTYYARYNDTGESKMLPQNNDDDYDTDDDCLNN